MSESKISVRFWGVRGSIPAPLTPKQVEAKIRNAAAAALKRFSVEREHVVYDSEYDPLEGLPFHERSTFGGNTTCVEVRAGGHLIILDMGTGLRELGIALMPETIKNKGIQGTIFQSHVHWDHIQGAPFWKQLYMPRSAFDNRFVFYGGKDWDKSLGDVLRGQMDPPMFPVDMGEIEKTALRMEFNTVWDGRVVRIPAPAGGEIVVICRKLNHPQETYGYRIEYGDRVVAFCTDHEPYAAGIPNSLLALARRADLFITDCQYSKHEYTGEVSGVQKMGWGHSFPEYIAEVAREAKPKLVVTTHHDPEADDEHIVELARQVQVDCHIRTVAAFEGLAIEDGTLPAAFLT